MPHEVMLHMMFIVGEPEKLMQIASSRMFSAGAESTEPKDLGEAIYEALIACNRDPMVPRDMGFEIVYHETSVDQGDNDE